MVYMTLMSYLRPTYIGIGLDTAKIEKVYDAARLNIVKALATISLTAIYLTVACGPSAEGAQLPVTNPTEEAIHREIQAPPTSTNTLVITDPLVQSTKTLDVIARDSTLNSYPDFSPSTISEPHSGQITVFSPSMY